MNFQNHAGRPLKIIQLIRFTNVYNGSTIDPKYAAQFLAAVGKGRSSPLNNMIHFGSFRPSTNWQGGNFTQFCTVSKGKCFKAVSPAPVTNLPLLQTAEQKIATSNI